MTTEEAVLACEFWTTNVAETVAIFSTRNPEVGEALSGVPFMADRQTNSRGWGGTVGRYISVENEDGEIEATENPLYTEILALIEKRKALVV